MDAVLLIDAGILLLEAGFDRFHFRLSLSERDAFAKASEDNHGMIFAVELGAVERHGHPDVKLAACAEDREAARQNADDGERFLIEQDILADDCGITSEAALPQTVGDNCNLIVAHLIFFRDKIAAEERRYAEQVKEICGSVDAEDLLGFDGAGEVVEPGTPGGKSLRRSGSGRASREIRRVMRRRAGCCGSDRCPR